jgi:hypothetical protein
LVERLLGLLLSVLLQVFLPVLSDCYPFPPNHKVALNNDENQDNNAGKGEEFKGIHGLNFVNSTKK